MNIKNKINWFCLSRYRNELMGISIISIIIFHYMESFLQKVSGGAVHTLFRIYVELIGSIGVELFLFLSGMGLYFSMTKNSNTVDFYKKRLKRILLPYALWGAVFWFIKDILIYKYSFGTFLLDFTLISFWTQGNKNLWYIALIILLYILFPFLFRFLSGDSENREINTFVIFALITGFIFALKIFFPQVYSNTEIALYRILIFILGTYYGFKVHKKMNFSIPDFCMLAFGLFIKAFYLFGNRFQILDIIPSRIAQCFYSVTFLIVIALIIQKINSEGFNKFLSLAGKLSFELYITHVGIRTIMNATGFPVYKPFNYLICIVLSCLISWLLSKLVGVIFSKSQKLKEEKV